MPLPHTVTQSSSCAYGTVPSLGGNQQWENEMPRGEKSAYTDKQKRQAEHIEESEIDQGRSRDDAERIAWATVNKQDGGGKKSAAGRKTANKSTSSKAATKSA
jgi:hypothetical protein